MKTPRSRVIPVLAVILASLVITACDKDLYVIDPKWSVNVFKPSPKWPPKEKDMKPAELEAFRKFGKPDAFHVLWDPTGRIYERHAITERVEEAKKGKKIPPFTWVYIGRGVEVFFEGAGYQERPLGAKVKLIAQFGDPEDAKDLENGVTQWMFYSTGKLYKISHDKIIEEKTFPAMGQFTKQ